MDKSNLLNIVICIILISAVLIIISLESSKRIMENFYQDIENQVGQNSPVESNVTNNSNTQNNSNLQANSDLQANSNSQEIKPNEDINEDQLKAMCQNMGTGPEAEIKTLRMSLLDLNHHTSPSFWFNDHICVYRMERKLSLNPNITKQNLNDDDYYYPLSDVLLFKNYDAYMKGELNNNQNNNLINNNINSESTLIFPSPSMDVEEVVSQANNVVPQTLTIGDSRVDNYNQPGVEGLKIMVKNGKKPLAYTPNPSAILPGRNGENLYVWEPIAPENYVCLGCVCTVSVRPTVPNINECPIRCVPVSCADELPLTLSDDIKIPSISLPYHLFSVSNGKFFKGNVDMPNQTGINIRSHDIPHVCDNTELDDSDKPVTIKLHYQSTDMTGTRKAENELSSNSFNSVKGYFNKEFETFLVNKPELQLNDYPNNPPNPIIKPSGKRYIINSLSKVNDKVELFLSLNKRAFAYNQLSCTEMFEALSGMIGTHKISLNIFSKDYHLVLEKVEVANMYVFDPNKIDWEKTFVDPELVKEDGKVDKVLRGGYQYKDDPFKFNKDMDSFLKISNNMEGVEMA